MYENVHTIFSIITVTPQSDWTPCSSPGPLLTTGSYQNRVFCFGDLLTPNITTQEFCHVRSVSTGECGGCWHALSVPFRMERLVPQLPRGFPACLKAESLSRSCSWSRQAALCQVMAPSRAVGIQHLVHVWKGPLTPIWDKCERLQSPPEEADSFVVAALQFNSPAQSCSTYSPAGITLKSSSQSPSYTQISISASVSRETWPKQCGKTPTTCCWMRKQIAKQRE